MLPRLINMTRAKWLEVSILLGFYACIFGFAHVYIIMLFLVSIHERFFLVAAFRIWKLLCLHRYKLTIYLYIAYVYILLF